MTISVRMHISVCCNNENKDNETILIFIIDIVIILGIWQNIFSIYLTPCIVPLKVYNILTVDILFLYFFNCQNLHR